jgi:sec-independent protein translocase protein TatC
MYEPNDSSNSTPGQSLIEHLTELRNVLVKAAWAIGLATAACWYFHNELFDIIRGPIAPYLDKGGLVFTHPIDKFMAHLKVTVLAGVMVSAPIWLYQAWQFVAPGLYAHERRYSLVFIASGTLLFLVGTSFAYFLVLPAAFHFLLSFGGQTDRPMITIENHLSFVTSMMLVFGFAFELPLVIVVLGAIGIVDQKFLREKRRIMIVILAVVSAIVTPPDAMSMLSLLVPLIILYEISILLVGAMHKKRKLPT